MPNDHESLLTTEVADQPVTYTERDGMLYALALGFGSGLGERRELSYVLDGAAAPKTLPTLASTLADQPRSAAFRCAGFLLELYRPLPPVAKLLASRRVLAVREAGGETEIVLRSEVRIARDDTALYTLDRIVLAGGAPPAGAALGAVPEPHLLPGRRPDLSCDLDTRPEQALLFRLAGRDSDAEAEPGTFEPMLDGRFVYGIACRAILRTICDYDYTLIRSFDARCLAPVAAGETVTTEMWQERNVVSFRCCATRDRRVLLDHGRCLLAA